MSSLAHSSIWQYAVISVRSESRCERFVIAYPDEKTLRDLLAAQSIVGLGYRSRDEAQANIECYKTTAHPLYRELTATLVATTGSLERLVANHNFSRGGFDLGGIWRIIRNLLQHSLAVAIVVLYSKNVLAKAVRALISV